MPWIKPPVGIVTPLGYFYCNACQEVLQASVLAHVGGAGTHSSVGACDRCGVTEETLQTNNPPVHEN